MKIFIRSETKTAAQTTDSTVNASTSESMSHDSMVQNIVDMGYNRTMVCLLNSLHYLNHL